MQEQEGMESLFQSFNVKYFDYKYRLSTFIGKWKYDNLKDSKCTSKRLAKAGFICTATDTEPDSARCFICQHELLWDPEDEPMSEHEKHRSDCEFVKIKKNSDDYTVRDWIRLLAYANSVQMYSSVDDTISNLESLMNRLVANVEKVL